jgi:HD superfamily phosphohydrolase
MAAGDLRKRLLQAAPNLTRQTEILVRNWLEELLSKLSTGALIEFRPKQVNDPIWGTIELLPWEVALLDTPLLQRMRGVRQLGLAQLVFPGASHGRLEHIIGVVGAVEEAIRALSRQIERWNRDHKQQSLPTIDDRDRFALRLAALFHDIGHGPFSHALEPVLEVESPLGTPVEASEETDWRRELRNCGRTLREEYTLDDEPAISEIIAVFFVLSDAMHAVLASDKVMTERSYSADELQEFIVSAIIGANRGPGASHLSALVSSQIDADKLDYLSRDAHHSGLEIGFDTDRLLARLEVLRVRADNLDGAAAELRQRAAESSEQMFYQLGIAASGFGSFEQMLIGRTFLYDRLYHHHKVRAAEAMAQRLMLIAERDRGRRFEMKEIFLSVDDDTMLRLFSNEVTHRDLSVPSASTIALAKGIIDRKLLHRAFAFRGRFIASPPGLDAEKADQNRRALWGRIVKDLDGLGARFSLGAEIHEVALRCCDVITGAGVDLPEIENLRSRLSEVGAEQIIVDLPGKKAEAIRILARYPNGAIRVPEFSFNPVKWSDAYDLQKRTGYVFCPRDVAIMVGLASKIVFLAKYGVVMAEEADGYIKAKTAPPSWIAPLIQSQVIDRAAADHLTQRRYSLLRVRPEDLQVPQEWILESPDLAIKLSNNIQEHLSGGLTAEHMRALGDVLAALYAFTDMWFGGRDVTSELADEAELQERLRQAFAIRGLKVGEGTEVNGGELDLFVADAVLVENKFKDASLDPQTSFPAAGMQGRRYAIALGSQVVIVVGAIRATAGSFPNKTEVLTVRSISSGDKNRVEIRFILPFGAPAPSREKAEKANPS